MDKETSQLAPKLELETIEDQCKRILATLASQKARQITPPSLSAKQRSAKKREWLNKFLKLKTHHPELVELENKVYEFVAGYAVRPGRGAGKRLLITGENGSGKSHTAKSIARWHRHVSPNLRKVLDMGDTPYSSDVGILSERAPKYEFRNWLKFIKTIKGGEWDAIKTLCHAELVIVDDVGADHDPSKFATAELYELLERREYDWTVITTNVSPDKWEDRFDRRVSSRFLRNTIHVALDNVPDFNSL